MTKQDLENLIQAAAEAKIEPLTCPQCLKRFYWVGDPCKIEPIKSCLDHTAQELAVNAFKQVCSVNFN